MILSDPRERIKVAGEWQPPIEPADPFLLDDFDRPDESPVTGWDDDTVNGYTIAPAQVLDGKLTGTSAPYYSCPIWPEEFDLPVWFTFEVDVSEYFYVYLDLNGRPNETDLQYDDTLEVSFGTAVSNELYMAVYGDTSPDDYVPMPPPGTRFGVGWDGDTATLYTQEPGGEWEARVSDSTGPTYRQSGNLRWWVRSDDGAVDNVRGGEGTGPWA